jgi:hypothetical protein
VKTKPESESDSSDLRLRESVDVARRPVDAKHLVGLVDVPKPTQLQMDREIELQQLRLAAVTLSVRQRNFEIKQVQQPLYRHFYEEKAQQRR